MSNVTSSLTVRLVDQVSGPSKSISAALKSASQQATAVAKALSGTGASRSFANQLSQIGLSAKEIQKVSREFQKYAAAAGIAGKASSWTKDQTAQVRAWENATVASLKRATEAQKAYATAQLAASEKMAKARAKEAEQAAKLQALARQDMLDRRAHARETITSAAQLYAAHKLKEGVKATAHTYREFDKMTRATEAFGNYSEAEMAKLVEMAIHKSAGTRFNDIQWLEAAKMLGGRGVKANSAMGILPEAAHLGQALDQTLPEAVRVLEGSLFAFQRDLSTEASARREARRAADMQAAAAKASGMDSSDLEQLYKYGAVGANLSKIMEPWLLAFGGLGKKINIGGDEMGVAFRTMTSKLLAPTQKGREALAAHGINYSQFQKMPDRLNRDNFESMIAQQYGVKLNDRARGKIDKIFTDKATFTNASRFAVAMADALTGQIGIKDAKDRKKVVGSAERFRHHSVNEVDAPGLLMAIMSAIKGGNLALANAVFTDKQGGRVMAALRDSKIWTDMVEKIMGAADGTAERIGKQRMAGFDGAMYRWSNAIKNLETAFGRAFDNNGKGGFATSSVNFGAGLVQGFAELSQKSHLAAGTLAVVGGSYAAVKGVFGLFNDLTAGNGPALALTGSATALGRSAWRLQVAATALEKAALANGGKPWPSAIVPAAVPPSLPAWAPGAALSGLGLAGIAGVTYALGSGIRYGIDNYVPKSDAEQEDIRSRILTLERKIADTNAKSRIPEIAATLVAPLQHELQELKNRLNAGRPESALPSFAHNMSGANTGQRKVDPTGVAPPTVAWDIFGKLETSADQAKAKLQEVSNVTVFPKIETSGIDAANAKLDALKDKLWSVSAGMKNLGSVGTGVVGRSMRGANAD